MQLASLPCARVIHQETPLFDFKTSLAASFKMLNSSGSNQFWMLDESLGRHINNLWSLLSLLQNRLLSIQSRATFVSGVSLILSALICSEPRWYKKNTTLDFFT